MVCPYTDEVFAPDPWLVLPGGEIHLDCYIPVLRPTGSIKCLLLIVTRRTKGRTEVYAYRPLLEYLFAYPRRFAESLQ